MHLAHEQNRKIKANTSCTVTSCLGTAGALLAGITLGCWGGAKLVVGRGRLVGVDLGVAGLSPMNMMSGLVDRGGSEGINKSTKNLIKYLL